MKIIGNWKLFIIMLNVVIVASIIGLVIYSLTMKIDLVEEDYYQKGQNYQKQVNKINRSAQLTENVKIDVAQSNVLIKFPKVEVQNPIGGKINFYRPSKKEKDFFVPVVPDSGGTQTVPFSGRDKGVWIVKIDWNNAGNDYYFEEEILVY